MTRAVAAALVAVWAAGVSAAWAQPPGAAEHAEAERLLGVGDGEAALESAFAAIRRSDHFEPTDWSQEVPEGRIVLDEFTGAANAAYRLRRAAYRVTLGDALAAVGDAGGAAREYRRAVALDPLAETWRRLADLPGIPLSARVDGLLRSWARSGGSDEEALELLRETGAFRTENGLAAALDRFRFRAPETSRRRPPEGTTPYEGVFPSQSLAVEGGIWSSDRSFAEGRPLVLYFPADGCPRCGEVLDELQTALRGQPADVIAAVSDADLAILNRIAGLTGGGFFMPEPQSASTRSRIRERPIGHVVRRDTVGFRPDGDTGGTLWLAARAGLSVWRIPLGGGSVRRDLSALFRFLDDSPVEGSGAPLVEVLDDAEGMIEVLRRLAAGAEPVRDIEDRLLNAVRTGLRGASDPAARGVSLLRAASGLEAGDAARLALLARIVPRFGERLLQAAQALDPEVVRAIPGGRLRAAAVEESLVIQRDYEGADGAALVLSAVVRSGDPGELEVLEIVPGRALSVTARDEGLVFARERPDGEACLAWGPAGGPFDEDCAADFREGAIALSRSQLPRGNDAGEPGYRVRIDGGAEAAEVTALTEGLAAFAAGEVEAAGAAFTRASEAIGPGSPLDMAAVRFNLALVAEAQGDREEALAALQAIGDATFPGVLEEAIRRLYRAGERR
ncbi:MAG: hypothetical protein OXH05_08790 [Acidobacteria bacterium]|nr:hypothetical protein [Acidobacteriota bacterium]